MKTYYINVSSYNNKMKSFSSLFKQEHITFTKNKTSLSFFQHANSEDRDQMWVKISFKSGFGFQVKG